MRLILTLSILSTSAILAGCATKPQPISLAPGPIICPQSLLTPEEAPPPLAQEVLQQMTPEAATAVQQWGSWWENVLANAEGVKVEALQACADYNRALSTRSGGNLGG